MTHSHETSANSFWGILRYIVLKTADSAGYFGVQMKTVIQKVLKLWSFEVAKRNGSHFEKTALKELCLFAYFP